MCMRFELIMNAQLKHCEVNWVIKSYMHLRLYECEAQLSVSM